MKEKRNIEKVAVLGSGVMGSQIACHLANIGFKVILLDILPKAPNEKEEKKGLSIEDRAVRDRVANDALNKAVKMNPSPVFSKSVLDRIETGNFEDDLERIADCDWSIEAIVEDPKIKKEFYDRVEECRKPGTLFTTNTSGIPIHKLSEERGADFRKHFFGTHFFNPPRYLKLLEIIPAPDTDPDILDFFMEFGHRELGKTTVKCKDTPAFIANRVGVYSIMDLFHIVKDMGLTVNEVDKLTGPVLGRPKSATFRTCDVVGLDTLVNVAKGLKENCPEDEANDRFTIPDHVQKMVDNNMLGSKTGQGFYKKVKDDQGKSQILELNLDTLEYQDKSKVSFPSLDMAMQQESVPDQMRTLFKGEDKAGEFTRRSMMGLFKYVSNRVPEIADEVYKIDDALRAGFGWKFGPFETWDILGVKKVVEKMEEAGEAPAAWIKEMLDQGFDRFYKTEDGKRFYYDQNKGDYVPVPGSGDLISLSDLSDDRVLWKNSESTITDIGDGILNVSFHSKMNVIGGEILKGLNQAIDMAESEYAGVVISNEGDNFSAGANVGLILMMAAEQDLDELDMAVQQFQRTMMRIRYSSVPVIAAPHNMALGGGCELCMHADKVIAHAETYIGLVEFGAGLIPGGGGTKEFAMRTSDEIQKGDVRVNALQNRFLTIGQAKVATSAIEGFEHGYLRRGQDEVIMSRDHQLTYAKDMALDLLEKGYVKPAKRKDIQVLGNEGLGIVYAGADAMRTGNYITDHDQKISEKLGWVMCGGDLAYPMEVSEEYLLKLEKKAFMELCMEQKTLKRMESIVKTGKPLRN